MILEKFSLKDKVAIVTGANTGLGQGICWAFAEAGAKIAGVGRSDMTETREYIEKIGGEFFEIKADLMSSDCVLPIIDATVEHYGKIDYVFVSKHFKVESVEIPARLLSDHKPYIAYVELPDAE